VTDLILAIAHHLLVFSLPVLLATEAALVRPGMPASTLKRVGIIDIHYGAVAGAAILVGFARVFWGVKGPEAYLGNPFFWGKIATFAIVGLLSVPPTLRVLAWRRASRADPAFSPDAAEVGFVRRFFLAEALLFVPIPVFAAAMARGYGVG
jgi:putative membrane protein